MEHCGKPRFSLLVAHATFYVSVCQIFIHHSMKDNRMRKFNTSPETQWRYWGSSLVFKIAPNICNSDSLSQFQKLNSAALCQCRITPRSKKIFAIFFRHFGIKKEKEVSLLEKRDYEKNEFTINRMNSGIKPRNPNHKLYILILSPQIRITNDAFTTFLLITKISLT